ncbi:glutamyl-tRNA reductase, partial [Methylobacterium sp. WL103]
MSLLVTLAADGLVAILLVATIVSSMKLSRRIVQLKGDEAALRQTIGDLMVATASAERAIAGLRNTLDECDRTLAERLGTAERYAADIAAQVEAGEGVIARIGAIVTQMRGAAPRPAAPEPAP